MDWDEGEGSIPVVTKKLHYSDINPLALTQTFNPHLFSIIHFL